LQKFGDENLIYYIWHTPSDRYDIDLLKKRKEVLVDELMRWDNRFKQKNNEMLYAIGNQFTLADIFLFPQLAFLVHCGYPIQLHEQLGKKKKNI
jgi:glutathione S-transferase